MLQKSKRGWNVAANIVMCVLSFLALAPFVLLVIASFTDEQVALTQGYSYFPAKLSLAAYEYIAAQWEMLGRAYLMTIVITAAGTVLSIIMTALLGYVLSERNLPGRKVLNL